MLITRLYGGLGNQIFQWAAGQSIADRHNTQCLFDLSHFGGEVSTEERIERHGNQEGPTPWGLELNKLDLELKFVQGNTLGLPRVSDNHVYKPLGDNLLLDGYWQSEKYFLDNEENIRSKLRMGDQVRGDIHRMYPFLKDETVSLHVRRGDYVRLQHAHPCQTLEYYDAALDIVEGKGSNILVFSDDLEWCKQNFKYDSIYFAEGQSNIIDMYTMSLCSHNIISNSTFGWWGSWLNESKDKKIVAPKNWFGNGSYNAEDIIPSKWIKL